MSGFIPKEKLTAYQRWELAAFDEDEAEPAESLEPPKLVEAAESREAPESPEPAEAPASDPELDAEAPPAEADDESAPIILPTAAEIERMHDEAREQGYAAGREEGLAEARQTAARIAEILDGIRQAVGEIEQGVAEQLLSVALEIAHQVLRQSLEVKPELILPVVREALATLQLDSGRPALLAHPGDAAIIREQLGDHLAHNDWRIIEDASLTRGGCRIKMGASEVDATLETRWKRALKTIAATSDWLDS
ncbi:MAG: flagellar assembly protein FliH [Candidatus Accumulibacter sp.]|jgi:flagellar assembly protein FliH|nr:flagellar assembly protein FliH [Accumulibacter sp.]